jgi:peptide/nickel transport system substrate-binding protein
MIEDAVRPVIYPHARGHRWQPQVKNLSLMVNSAYNSWRMEDAWLDR